MMLPSIMRAALLAVFAALAVEAQWASMDGMGLVMCGNWAAKLDEMNRVCWCVLRPVCRQPRCRLTQTVCRHSAEEPGGQCPNGFPSTCTQECAGIFGNFEDARRTALLWPACCSF